MYGKPLKVKIGDIVRLKKPHPCGSYRWEIIRIGADLKIKCKGCGHSVIIDRGKLRKRVLDIEEREER